jgi:hypothetical protein
MMGSGELDRLVGALRQTFPDLAHDVEDAVFGAVGKLLERHRERPVEHVGAWLYEVAKNSLLRLGARRAKQPGTELVAQPRDPAEVVYGRETLRLVIRIIDAWENAHIRVVTRLYIEAAWLGEPLSLIEARDQATSILAEELSITSIGTWKSRGFERLAAELTRFDYRMKPSRS